MNLTWQSSDEEKRKLRLDLAAAQRAAQKQREARKKADDAVKKLKQEFEKLNFDGGSEGTRTLDLLRDRWVD